MALTWHVVMTRIARETAAAIEIMGQGFEVFFPVHHRQRIHNHRIETIAGPLFPRYIFSRFDRDEPGWNTIKADSKHVVQIIRDGQGRPVILPDPIMDEIKNRLPHSPQSVSPGEFLIGQRVRVSTGILEGVEGLFQGTAAQRTKVLLDIMGKRVEVPIATVEII
jgi:transcriptional antiterminator RfaH